MKSVIRYSLGGVSEWHITEHIKTSRKWLLPPKLPSKRTARTNRTLHLETQGAQGKCSKCGRCGTATRGEKGQLTYTIATLCWKGIGLGVEAREQFIK